MEPINSVQPTIRRYREGEEDNIVQFLVEGFNGWPHFDLNCTPKDHWVWKFIENPQRIGFATVAEINNRIVSCNHMLASKIKIGNGVYTCQQWVDTVTHKEFRGKGIYSKIRNLEEEKLKLTNESIFDYAATTNPIIIKKEDKMGSKQLAFPFLRLVKIQDINVRIKDRELSSQILLKSAHTVAKSLNEVKNVLGKKTEVQQNINIVEINRFDERIETFWGELKEHYKLILERNGAYLNWRYCDHRGGNYVVRQAEKDGRIIGFIVLRVNRFDAANLTGYVVDLCVLPDQPDCAYTLVADAVNYFDDQKVNMVSYLIHKTHPYQELFAKFGFLDSRNNVYISYFTKNIDEEKNIPDYPSDKILLQYGDFDWI